MNYLEVREAYDAFRNLAREPVHVSLAAKIARILRALGPEYELSEEMRQKIAERHVTRNEDGKPAMVGSQYEMTGEAAYKAQTEFNEFLSTEASVNGVQPLELQELTKHDLRMSAIDIERGLRSGLLIDGTAT